MRFAKPNAFEPGSEIRADKFCFRKPGELLCDQASVFNLHLKRHLLPGRMPRPETSGLIAVTKKSGVAFQGELAEGTWIAGGDGGIGIALLNALVEPGRTHGGSIRKTTRSRRHFASAIAFFGVMLVIARGKSVRQSEEPGRQSPS